MVSGLMINMKTIFLWHFYLPNNKRPAWGMWLKIHLPNPLLTLT